MARRRHRLAERRRTYGYSQEAFAEAVGVDRTAVSRWETAVTAPQPWHRRRIAMVLEVTLEELNELLADITEAPDAGRDRDQYDPVAESALASSPAQTAASQVAGTVARVRDTADLPMIDAPSVGQEFTHAAGGLAEFATILRHATGREVGATNRRQTLAWVLGAAAGASPFNNENRLTTGAGSVDRRTLASLRDAAESLASMYRTVDPRVVLSMAAAYADELLDLYDRRAGATERELADVVVGVHCQVGLWACHAHQPAQARRYLATACEVAVGVDDPPLYARALGALSYLYSSAPRGGGGGNPVRTLELLTRSLALTSRSDAFTRGWLATWRADQHATLGDLIAARADVELADVALETGDSGPERGFFARRHYGYGMRGHLDSVRGLVHALAGDLDESERVFRNVQEHAANGRRRVASLGHQALAYTRTSEPEAACDALYRSIALAVVEPYPMGLKRAIGIRAGFDQRWKSLPRVRELDQRLQLARVGT